MHEHSLARIFKHRATTALLIFMIIYTIVAIGGNVLKYSSYQKELATHSATIDQLSQDNLQLSELLTFLNSDDAVDTYARTRLGFQQEGERAYIITEDTVETTTRVDDLVHNEESNTHKWYRYYFSK